MADGPTAVRSFEGWAPEEVERWLRALAGDATHDRTAVGLGLWALLDRQTPTEHKAMLRELARLYDVNRTTLWRWRKAAQREHNLPEPLGAARRSQAQRDVYALKKPIVFRLPQHTSGRGGVYAFSFPDHAADVVGRRKIKVGCASFDCHGRIAMQLSAAADAPEVLRVYESENPRSLERAMHQALDDLGRRYVGGGGREWFYVSPDELDEVHLLCGGTMAVPATPLERCETIIERAQSRFVRDARSALLAIHDGRLYLDSYRSFEEYLIKRWGISKATGYRMLEQARELAAGESKPQVNVSHGETPAPRPASPDAPLEASAAEVPNAHLFVGKEDVIPVGQPSPAQAVPLPEPARTTVVRWASDGKYGDSICEVVDRLLTCSPETASAGLGVERVGKLAAWANEVKVVTTRRLSPSRTSLARDTVTPHFKGGSK